MSYKVECLINIFLVNIFDTQDLVIEIGCTNDTDVSQKNTCRPTISRPDRDDVILTKVLKTCRGILITFTHIVELLAYIDK